MAQHEISVHFPILPASSADFVFAVTADGEALGRLTVSRGGVGWYPAGPSKERHLRWEDFDALIRKEWREA